MDDLDILLHRSLLRQLKGVCTIYESWINGRIESDLRQEAAKKREHLDTRSDHTVESR